MELIVASTPYSQWQQLCGLLQRLGWDQARCPEPEQAANHAKLTTTQACLFLYTPAHIAIAYALDQGQTPSLALQHWHTALRQCLHFYRHHRRQILLINVMQAAHNPQALLQLCRQRFGITAEPIPLTPVAPPSALNLLLAQQQVMQQAELADMMQELEAGTAPLQDNDPRTALNMDRLHRQLVQQAQICAQQGDLLGQLAEQKQENSRLLAQLHRIQEELAALHQQNRGHESALHEYQTRLQTLGGERRQLQDRLDSLTREHADARAELRSQRQEKKDVEEENDMLLQQLHHVQEELEHYYLNNQGLTQRLDEQQRQRQQQNQALQRLTTSVSWKITAPLRALGKLFRKTSPEQRDLKKQLRLLAGSELFDADWYLATYPDVAESGMDPGEHYLKFGADEGRNPGPHFNTNTYLQLSQTAAKTKLNPLVHYLTFGQEEGRLPKATA